MSQPPELQVERLRRVAHDLAEVFAERGYRVDSAMEVDPAFGSGTARSAVARDLAVDAVSRAASQHGLDFRPVNGSGREFRCLEAGTDRRFRLKRARRTADGGYLIVANSDSALAVSEDSLFHEESWVFGYTLGDDHLIADIFIAPVRGYEEGRPGHLVLGPITELLTGHAPVGGFRPAEEPLDGFEDDEQDESGEFHS